MSGPHALVIGGTGMLRGVVLALAREGAVSVVARTRTDIEVLARDFRTVVPVSVDYRRTADLGRALEDAVAARGPFTTAVAWIHSDAPEAPLVAARAVRGPFFHILSSAEADPSRPDAGRRARFEAIPGITYHEVILGFVRESGRSRWLANSEIARGVLDAVAAARPRVTVGTVEPWSERP